MLAISCSGSGPDGPHDVICPVYAPNLLPSLAGPRDIPTESAGTIPGTFSVSRTGEAVYTMPLSIVPGRAGVQPSLAIVYDSGQGEGLFGVGFSLAGLSSITRCPQNLAQDGRVRGVRYDEDDKLCLDGLRLVPIGSHEDARLGHVEEYRTFPDTFQRVLAFYPKGWSNAKGPKSFEVYTKTGRILEYGGEKSGRVLGKGGVVRAWWVTRDADRRDNAVLYTYTNDTDLVDGHTVTHAPLRIDYTDHPSAPATRSIRFKTFAWNAHPYGYTGGVHTGRMMRINRIEMYGPGDTPVRTYAFGYDESWSTGRARLVSAVECAGLGDGACKPPTRFGWLDATPGFTKITTDITHPSYDNDRSYYWLATDLDGDGLDDLTITRASNPLASDPVTGDHEEWLTALSTGQGFGPLQLGFTTARPEKAVNPGDSEPGALAHFNIVPHPYDIEGHTGLLYNDPVGYTPRWLRRLPDGSMSQQETGVTLTYRSPETTSSGVLYADLDGDGVPDLVECEEKDKQTTPDQTKGIWTMRRWRVESDGFTTGFGDPEPVPGMGERNCLLLHYIKAVDVDSDGKSELLVPPHAYPPHEQGICQAPCTYQALAWDKDGWTSTDTQLPPPQIINVLHPTVLYFADVNGDGLPDAFETGFDDGVPRTFLNTGRGFVGPIAAAATADVGGAYFERASTLDYDGDGQTDLLVPMDGHCDGPDQWRPCLVVWRSNVAGDGTFTLIDTKVPVMNPPAATRRSWLSPQVADINGDGRGDVILPLDGHYTILLSSGPSDLLTSIADGLNPLDPGDKGFVPNVTVAYDHLVDRAKLAGLPEDSPARESETYLPQSDDNNGCWYPRVCVVGPRRVVRAYQTNDGQNQTRTFSVRYRDGREDRRLGFLGFGTRIVSDLDALSGALERYDNMTYVAPHATYPYAGTPSPVWTWSPALPATQGPIELSFKDTTQQVVSTYGGATYFVLPVRAHELREQGAYPVPGSPSTTVLQYVAAAAESPATILRESTSEVMDHDAFGNVLTRFDHTEGVDETRSVFREITNDEADWLLGLVTNETECSTTSDAKACRTTTRTFTTRGELWTEERGDPNDPETQLTTKLTRDGFGNIVKTTADDAFGHHRSTCVRFDDEGVFPFAAGNPAGHIALYGYDRGLGLKAAEVDPNGLATTWRYDTLGRVAWELRPDGTSTHITLSRTKDGGPQGNWWRTRTKVAIDGGSETTTETDALGRAVRVWTRGPEVKACSDAQCTSAPTFVRDTVYDSYGRVKRRSWPYLAGDPPASVHYDEYRYDALGRVVQHTSPWNAVTTIAYDANTVFVDEPGSVHWSEVRDPLGRTVATTDAKGGLSTHEYGPFGVLRAVTTPDGLATSTEHDAYGRARLQTDPDRGVTESHMTASATAPHRRTSSAVRWSSHTTRSVVSCSATIQTARRAGSTTSHRTALAPSRPSRARQARSRATPTIPAGGSRPPRSRSMERALRRRTSTTRRVGSSS
jgi:YD repeat-containing protein